MSLLTTGCDELFHRLYLGAPVPDARLVITLPVAQSNYEIVQRMHRAAVAAGFPYSVALESQYGIANEHVTGGSWYPTSDFNAKDYGVYMDWTDATSKSPKHESFFFIFHNKDTSSFSAKEWRMFFDWKNVYFPEVFPNAAIEVTRHPAEVTDLKLLGQISSETGIPIPENLMADYEQWLAK